jgi:hypothetical protein
MKSQMEIQTELTELLQRVNSLDAGNQEQWFAVLAGYLKLQEEAGGGLGEKGADVFNREWASSKSSLGNEIVNRDRRSSSGRDAGMLSSR